jgi:hypothetical protein
VENLDFVGDAVAMRPSSVLTSCPFYQCISINQNFVASSTLPQVYQNLLESLHQCEESISDVKVMIQQRVDNAFATSQGNASGIFEWEKEWIEQVQSLLAMDAGWDFRGFWNMVLYNLKVRIRLLGLGPSRR